MSYNPNEHNYWSYEHPTWRPPTILDETHHWHGTGRAIDLSENSLLNEYFNLFDKHWRPVDKSAKIRVTLSRPLTWAEYEYLRQELPYYSPEIDQGTNREVIHFSGDTDSRTMYDEIASHLGCEFVNVYPRAVLTKQEAQ